MINILSHIKKLKLNYNQPSILNRINGENLSDSSSSKTVSNKKNKYLQLYSQYEKNIDFWSYDNLINNVQKRLLHIMVNYWWPKYCIRLNSFHDYVKQKYPSYYVQKNMIHAKQRSHIDLDIENIEKSIHLKYNKNERKTNNEGSIEENERLLLSKLDKSDVKAIEAAKKVPRPKLQSEYTSLNITKKYVTRVDSIDVIQPPQPLAKNDNPYSHLPANDPYRKLGILFDCYQTTNNFKTSLPVGWKRPISKVTKIVKAMMDERDDEASDAEKNKLKMDKEIYLDAIYREDIGGQIFMKYLSNKNKLFATNRLKCLQELIKYKDLFYDENFNQELVKKCGLVSVLLTLNLKLMKNTDYFKILEHL
jgi:hypothetical protein